MTSRFKVLMGCLSALLALSALGVGVAQAARPVQPQFISLQSGLKGGETLKSNVTIEDVSARTRLWSPTLGIVIRCERDSSEGHLEPKGRDTGVVRYKECKVFDTKENTTSKQFEEAEELTGCSVTEPIETALLKSRLVWAKGSNVLLTLYQPASGTLFVTIKITGTACLAKGEDKVEGTVLGQNFAPRFNVESTANFTLFGVKNGGSTVTQEATEFEVEEGGTLESGKDELTLAGKPTALEGGDQTERIREGTGAAARRGLFGIHE